MCNLKYAQCRFADRYQRSDPNVKLFSITSIKQIVLYYLNQTNSKGDGPDVCALAPDVALSLIEALIYTRYVRIIIGLI